MAELEELQDQAKLLSIGLGGRFAKVTVSVRAVANGTTVVDYWILGDGLEGEHFISLYDLKQAVHWHTLCALIGK